MSKKERESVCVRVCVYMYVYICFEGDKKAQKNSASAARGNLGPLPSIRSRDDIIHLQTLNTFRHQTPSDTKHLRLPGGAAGAMDASE